MVVAMRGLGLPRVEGKLQYYLIFNYGTKFRNACQVKF